MVYLIGQTIRVDMTIQVWCTTTSRCRLHSPSRANLTTIVKRKVVQLPSCLKSLTTLHIVLEYLLQNNTQSSHCLPWSTFFCQETCFVFGFPHVPWHDRRYGGQDVTQPIRTPYLHFPCQSYNAFISLHTKHLQSTLVSRYPSFLHQSPPQCKSQIYGAFQSALHLYSNHFPKLHAC